MKEIKLKTSETCLLREAVVDDALQMLSFLNMIAAESDNLTFGPGDLELTLDDEKKFISKIISSENELSIVAVLDGSIVGNIYFNRGVKPRTRHAGEFGVSVLKAHWNKGIAEALIVELMEKAAASRIAKINLFVRADNKGAIYLYEKLGFEIEGRQRRTFKIKGEFIDTLLMGKLID